MRSLAAAGARVAVLGRHAARLETVVAGIRAAGGEATGRLEVTDTDVVRDVFERVGADLGAPQIVIANAGVGAVAPTCYEEGRLSNYPDDTWDRGPSRPLPQRGVFQPAMARPPRPCRTAVADDRERRRPPRMRTDPALVGHAC